MKVLSLCSGYGGLELALSKALSSQALDLVAVCDNYGPARKVLSQHWPAAAQFKDVHDPRLDRVQADVVTFGSRARTYRGPGTVQVCGEVAAACSSGAPRSGT